MMGRITEIRNCKNHGMQKHFARQDSGWRCSKCGNEQVARRRRKVKAILVTEHGGKCKICGYSGYIGAFDFHHINPTEKGFGIANKGMTYSLAKMREEANKCILLCKRCHAEVEGGFTILDSTLGESARLLTVNEVGSNPTPGARK